MSAEPQLSGQVMFYRQPEPLSLEKHRGLGVKRVDRPFQFLLGAHVVPITVNEFGVAAGSYPVIFAGSTKTPLAVMGARSGENVFVSPLGEVDPEVYLPAFARRYPFVFAADSSGDRLVLCVDRAAPMIGENPDVPLFNGNEPSQYTQEAMEFCKEFERHRRTTENFIALINELNLFESKTVTITNRRPDGTEEQQVIAEYFAIDEDKLTNLPNDQFVRLKDNGALGPMYAHMVSLLQWPKVIQRAMYRFQTQAGAANTPLG
ncbi:MAG: SapC family protein [Hyphomonadaceae bacterium]|nr:SapC family protein [Hyphomonadaceae bacterium]